MLIQLQKKQVAILILSFLWVVLIEWFDHISGKDISFNPFYLVPILVVTWYVSYRWGVFFALGSTVAWIVADFKASELYSHPLVPLWNGLAGLSVFLFTVFLLTQVKKKQERKRELERIFFHDILNVATAIRGFAEILWTTGEDRETVAMHILASSERIIDEIESQRVVSAAEAHELEPVPETIDVCELQSELATLYGHHEVGREKRIRTICDQQPLIVETDPSLLGRIVGNMVKNALEASTSGDVVTLRSRRDGEYVELAVHNRVAIPPSAQTHIFRRSYSTKGTGRGLGTYGMKMLASILEGEVQFSSTPERGTTFRIRLPLTPQWK